MTAPVIAGAFTLGTVQLGEVYGLGTEQPSATDAGAAAVLDAASEAGIVWLDTARTYGCSEARVGQWLQSHPARFRIATKTAPLTDVSDGELEAATRRSIDTSLETLALGSVDICMVHRAADLRRAPVVTALRQAVADGKIKSFGASVYTPDEAQALLGVDDIGALQIPMSVVGQEFLAGDLIAKAAGQGVAVFMRSVFLQGALLMRPDQLPSHLQGLRPAIAALTDIAKHNGMALQSLLMGAVRGVPGAASLVLGVDSPSQLRELAQASMAGPLPPDIVRAAFRAGQGLPAALVDPRLWPKRATR